MNEFKKLGIADCVLKSIEEQGFEEPTEIQRKAIPLILAGKDVIAGSATGSGKTLAFASIIIQDVKKGEGIQSLVLTPTRELAEQITNMLRMFSKYKPVKIISIYGGVLINPQIENLKVANIVIGTPGRMLDHIRRGTIDLSKVKILVLDEADRMLDMGFLEDVESIISQCPKDRQTLLFSATITHDVLLIADRYMRNPLKISAEEYVDPTKLKQVYYDVPDNMKFSLLVHILKEEDSNLVMVFCNTRRTVDFVANNLKLSGINAVAIHGGFSQEKRNHVMRSFNSKKTKVLVCTDVAARGLDIQGVSHIYNYDVPSESKQYIHRIGRTARAGKEGKAITLLSVRDHDNFRRILRNNEVSIEKEEVPRVERVKVKWRENPRDFRARRSFGNRYKWKRKF